MENTSNSPLLESSVRETLGRMGLTPHDISIYEVLLKHPGVKTGFILKQTGIASSAVYASLDSLISRGLVSYQVINNIRKYRAESPQDLLSQLSRDAEALQALSLTVASSRESFSPRNQVNVYEGYHGFRRAFEETNALVERGETITIFGFGKEFSKYPHIRSMFKELDTHLVEKNARARVLLEKALLPVFTKDRQSIPIYDVRTLPGKYFGMSAVGTNKKEATLSLIAETPLVFKISNPHIVEGFRKNFDYLWKYADKLDS